jgi:hypothetical protein
LQLATFNAHDHSVGGTTALAFSDDCEFLFTAGADGGVFCWNVSNLALKARAIVERAPRPTSIRIKVLETFKAVDEPNVGGPSFLQQSEGRTGSPDRKDMVRFRAKKGVIARITRLNNRLNNRGG